MFRFPSQSSAVLGFFFAALAAALWSLITPFSRELFSLDCPPMETAFWRTLFGGLCFAAHALVAGRLAVPMKDALGMSVIGGLTGLVMFGPFQMSISLSGGATAVVLLYTAPAWVAVLSRVIFHDAISCTKLAAIGIAMAGVIMVSMSGGSSSGTFSPMGIACGLAAGFAYAAYFPFTYWYARRYSAQTIYAYAFLSAAVFMIPFAPVTVDKPASVWLLLTGMSVLTNYGAYVALAASLARITQVQSAVVGNIEPILGCIWVWLFFDENFTAIGWLGCALIMAAVFLLTMEKRRPAASSGK
ncbi:MAG: DMT family transporter [Desulfovibrionaceae bacterium]|nr:DMT family transporter [Desulfovibrionaceae bacterium]